MNHNSAADVAINNLFTDLNSRQGFDTASIDEETLNEWKTLWRTAIIEPLIQSQTKALAAELVELKAENEKLRQEFREMVKLADDRSSCIKDYILDDSIKTLCEKVGYGAVMDSAARQWQQKDDVGCHIIAGCRGTIDHILSQPTTQGFADAVLRLAVAAKNWSEGYKEYAPGCWRRDPYLAARLNKAAKSLTPEQMKLLEEMKGE